MRCINSPPSIQETVTESFVQDKLHQEFHELAEQRYAEIVASGDSIPFDEMRRHIQDRLRKNGS